MRELAEEIVKLPIGVLRALLANLDSDMSIEDACGFEGIEEMFWDAIDEDWDYEDDDDDDYEDEEWEDEDDEEDTDFNEFVDDFFSQLQRMTGITYVAPQEDKEDRELWKFCGDLAEDIKNGYYTLSDISEIYDDEIIDRVDFLLN